MSGLAYVLIAIGSALGGVSRAWVALAVARLAGPAFPWGTILINVAGSFVIGFFAAISVSNGRWPLPLDARAFIMVGFCGGFTTFSSFSLQTLELARDGRALQALGNIVVSVAVCLLAVAAGFYGAKALSPPDQTASALPATPLPVIALIDGSESAAVVLQAAARLASLTRGEAETIALTAPPAGAILLRQPAAYRLSEKVDTSEEISTTEREVRDAMAAIEASARGGAMIVVTPDALYPPVFVSQNPVLVVPPDTQPGWGRIVAIAWKNDGRALRAVQASLPILRQADWVHLIHAAAQPSDTQTIASFLHNAGIPAETHVLPLDGVPISARILAQVHALQADLLVMGAYAHQQWQEGLRGGVTRYMLLHADIPLFMRH